MYFAGREPLGLAGFTAIVVDDGIATGATMRVALEAARKRNPSRLVLATRVAAPDTVDEPRPLADEVVCRDAGGTWPATGFYYADFHEVSDDEICALLALAKSQVRPNRPSIRGDLS